MDSHRNSHIQTVAIIGGGPAGLMAAEIISQHGYRVDIYDAMPSVGRKFLLAGVGGMNITHSEPLPASFAAMAIVPRRSSHCCVPCLPMHCVSGFTDWASTPLSAHPGVFFPRK
jgi:predicted flavoprotein YhiN